MVRYIALALALLAACGICAGVGGFAGLQWLWILPLSFLGGFLGLAAMYFLFLCVCSALVDPEKTQKKDSSFYRGLISVTAQLVVWILRVRIHTEGLEKTPKDGRFFLVCNHLNNIDPGILLLSFPKSQLAFIAKRESKTMFMVGKLMRKIMCQFINRENDREALKTIINCIHLIQEDEVSVGVFPEGRITGDDLLHPFRSGVFKIAQKTKVPIVVCTLQNTQVVFKNAKKLKPTDVHMHLVGVVQPEEWEGLTTVDVADRVHTMMAEDLGPDLVWQENS